MAANLVAAGIEPGDRVALQLPDIPQFLASYFGILKAGALVVPLNVSHLMEVCVVLQGRTSP